MVDYQIKRSRRSLSLRVSISAQGQVVVSAPHLMPEFLVKKFVESQQVWIDKHLQLISKRQPKLDESELYIFDKKYQLHIDTNAKKSEVKVVGEQLLLHSTVTLSKKQIRDRLETFLKRTAAAYILRKTPIIAKQMEVSYQKISLRQQSSRWGSCSSHGNLNFNWRLVHYPPAVIDYVIVHELAHRIELNHSRKFWAIVRQHDGEYPMHKAALAKKRYNPSIT